MDFSALIACDFRILFNPLQTSCDQFLALCFELFHAWKTETMHIPQILVDNDQTSSREYESSEPFVVQVHDRRNHDPGNPFYGQSDGVVEKFHSPESLWVGIAHDGNLATLFLGQDIRFDQVEIALLVPRAM